MKGNIFNCPQLGDVMIIEKTSKENSGSFTRRQLWKHMPKKIAYGKFCTVIDYLLSTNKITTDRKGSIVWIWNPALVKKYLARKDLM